MNYNVSKYCRQIPHMTTHNTHTKILTFLISLTTFCTADSSSGPMAEKLASEQLDTGIDTW